MQAMRLNFLEITPQGGKALYAIQGYLGDCSLSKQLIELVNLRVSLINGCAYCIDEHSRELMKSGESIEKIRLVPVWHEVGDFFDARERAAFQWAESLTRLPETSAPDADYEAVTAVFDDREVVDLTLAISVMNAYNRVAVGLRVVPPTLVERSETST